MKKHLIVFGTRPEAIKMAPLVRAYLEDSSIITKVCVTAQHREMLDQVLDFFEIEPDFDLNIMKPNQNLYSLTADIITGLKPILEDYMGDYTLGRHPYTDVSVLGAFYDFSCINYSVGYYNMHSSREYVSIGYVQQARNIALEMISSLGNIKYPFIDESLRINKKRAKELALVSLKNLRK